MKNILILIIVAGAIYVGLVFKGTVSDKYLPETLKENVPQLNQDVSDEVVLPIEQRMFQLGKAVLTPLNGTSQAGEITAIANEIKANQPSYSAEAIQAGLQYCQQLKSLNTRKLELFKEFQSVQNRKEIPSNMKSRDHLAKQKATKKVLMNEKKYTWEQTIKGATPRVKNQLAAFIKLIEA